MCKVYLSFSSLLRNEGVAAELIIAAASCDSDDQSSVLEPCHQALPDFQLDHSFMHAVLLWLTVQKSCFTFRLGKGAFGAFESGVGYSAPSEHHQPEPLQTPAPAAARGAPDRQRAAVEGGDQPFGKVSRGASQPFCQGPGIVLSVCSIIYACALKVRGCD